MKVDFSGPNLKIRRAEHHIRDLEGIFERYVLANTPEVRTNRKGRRGDIFYGKKMPEHVPTILGDAIHNLRVALDHAYCILVETNGGTLTDRTKFPFGGDKKSVRGSIDGSPNSRPSEAILGVILDEFEPFPGGRLSLYELHRLDIIDKHMTLIPTTRTVNFDKTEISDAAGNIVGLISGVRVMAANNNGGPKSLVAFTGGLSPKENGVKSPVDILFGPGEFHNEPILPKLNELRVAVSGCLDRLNEVAAPRTTSILIEGECK